MSIYKVFGTDTSKETEGVWHEIAPGIRLKIARWNNPAFIQAVRKAKLPYKAIETSGHPLPQDIADKVMIEATAEAILVGWEGVTDKEDKPLACTKENKIMVLTDLPEVRNMVTMAAMSVEHYRTEGQASAEKNSVAPSAGS